MSLVVFKIGGSLLTVPGFVQRVGDLLEQRAGARHLLVVGGGEAADVVRRWHAVHGLAEEQSHWLAAEALRLNDALLKALMPDCVPVATRADVEAVHGEGRLPLLDSSGFLRGEPAAGQYSLPSSWEVTSDSIAAWAAVRFEADELVLVKSAAMPPGCDVSHAQQLGLVDGYFGRIAPRVPRISWSNLRDEPPVIENWLTHRATK